MINNDDEACADSMAPNAVAANPADNVADAAVVAAAPTKRCSSSANGKQQQQHHHHNKRKKKKTQKSKRRKKTQECTLAPSNYKIANGLRMVTPYLHRFEVFCKQRWLGRTSVSYTHLTLPTIYSV